MEDWLDLNPDPVHVKREREKARALRKTDWWKALVAKGECHYCHRQVGPEQLRAVLQGLQREEKILYAGRADLERSVP